MKKWLKRFAVFLVVGLIALAIFLVPTLYGKPWSVDHLYTRVLFSSVMRSPQLLTQLGLLKPLGFTYYEDDLDDASNASTLEFIRQNAADLETLRSYDRASMDPADQLHFDVMEFWLTKGLIALPEAFALHRYNVEPLSGAHTTLPDFMIQTHQLTSPESAGWYVDRVEKMAGVLDQTWEAFEPRLAKKMMPPRFILEKVAADTRAFVAAPALENALITHFDEKTETLEGLDAATRKALRARLVKAVTEGVYPTWKGFADKVEGVASQSPAGAGVWRLPEGDAFYQHMLEVNTTTTMTPDEIHALGRKKLAEIETEMKAILEAESLAPEDGWETTTPGVLLRRLALDPRFHYEDSAASREKVLKEYQTLIDEIDGKIGELFNLKPTVGVEVLAVPAFKESSSPFGYYNPPPVDMSRKGKFFVKLADLDEVPSFGMRTLAYHEAIPGHHFQIATAMTLDTLPMFRRLLPFTAYGEGWALYAETLAAEHGYQDNPMDRLGYLSGQQHRATRLVVDTGLHAKRWTREQTVDFMRAHTAIPEKDVQAETDRYVVWPGQACAYMVGQEKILGLRAKAKAALGDKFDIKAFHDVIIGGGGLPLTLLERQVDAFIGG